jgi:hypothetical protein
MSSSHDRVGENVSRSSLYLGASLVMILAKNHWLLPMIIHFWDVLIAKYRRMHGHMGDISA